MWRFAGWLLCNDTAAALCPARRKQKWSVDPRNSAWSNDDSKFGQKMLERMGWSKGKVSAENGSRLFQVGSTAVISLDTGSEWISC